jgi:uncharacterized protein
MQFPCELVVWKILPAIKAQIARNLKEKGMRQKDIAKALDSTEAAISQYLSGKRAADFKISDEMNDMLDVVAGAIAEGKNQKVLKYGVCQICKAIRTQGHACDACKTESGEKGDCDLCMK